jgi:ATP-binding cassette subfamily A (ABC1) protein 3
LAFFLVLPLLLTFMRNVQRVLSEKEKRLKEGMKMMGLSNVSFYTSWIAF